MKCLGVLVVLCAFAAVQAFGQEFPIIIPSKRTVVPPPVAKDEEVGFSCDAVNRISCGSCSSVMICNYNGKKVGGYECASIDPSRPYCIGKGICSSEPAPNCNVKSDLCPTADRFYPVPSKCSELVYCTDEQTAIKVSSPAPNAIFNYATQSWVLRVAPTDCFEIDCDLTDQLDKWYAYKPSQNLSIYCSAEGPMTFACPNPDDIFNESTKSCEFACSQAGNFPYPGDETRYYLCLPDPNGGFQQFENTCLSGFKFSVDKCVKS